jgi:hypothetical protein
MSRSDDGLIEEPKEVSWKFVNCVCGLNIWLQLNGNVSPKDYSEICQCVCVCVCVRERESVCVCVNDPPWHEDQPDSLWKNTTKLT